MRRLIAKFIGFIAGLLWDVADWVDPRRHPHCPANRSCNCGGSEGLLADNEVYTSFPPRELDKLVDILWPSDKYPVVLHKLIAAQNDALTRTDNGLCPCCDCCKQDECCMADDDSVWVAFDEGDLADLMDTLAASKGNTVLENIVGEAVGEAAKQMALSAMRGDIGDDGDDYAN